MFKWGIVISFLIASCRSKSYNCALTADELLTVNTTKVYTASRPGDSILVIVDKGKGKRKGAYYFYENGILESYKFFENDSVYSYFEDYDSEGRPIKKSENAVVHTQVREVNADSAIFELQIFSLHRSIDSIYIRVNSGSRKWLNSYESPFSNMKTSSFSLSTTGMKRITVYITFNYTKNCIVGEFVSEDTMSLVKNPLLNFARVQ